MRRKIIKQAAMTRVTCQSCGFSEVVEDRMAHAAVTEHEDKYSSHTVMRFLLSD